MKNEGVTMKGRIFIVLMILGLTIALSGCAGSKIYLMEVKYIGEKNAGPTARIVGICPFEDERKDKGKDLIGLRRHRDKRVDLIKLEGLSLPDSVTKAVRDYFADNGFQVTDCKGWDMRPEGLDRLPSDLTLVVGGKIDSFMIEAKSGIMTTDIQYTIKMRALIGKIEDRTVVIRTIESTPIEKKMRFDPVKVRGRLNSLLTEALQNLLEECL
jgi:hypothetical protein